ncbi:integrase [Paraburkholderia sp. WSM4175]|uniref:tyrosine-type recombinase/integrase n=1 Tax=Paraburkholderia sp. WSM4175 TaxID=2991072 RepID=UPI003D1B8C00
MATIRERKDAQGNKSYHVQIRLKGFPPQTRSFDSKTLAKQWAAQVEADLRAGRYMQRVEAERHTVHEMIDRYRKEVLLTRKPQREADQGRVLDWWASRLGAYSLAELTPALIGSCRDEFASIPTPNGGTRAAATVVRSLATFSHVLSVAVKEWQWLETSPMSRVAKPRVNNERVRHLSDDERERLLAATGQSTSRYLHVIVVTAISTGMRYSEIMHLRWRDITLPDQDGDYGLILLNRTKNGERRGVPLTGVALLEIKRMNAGLTRTNAGRAEPGELLFPSDRRADQPMNIRPAWDAARRKAGIEDFRFHDLRHTTASYLAMGGATAPEIAEILGHKTLNMVKRYAHFGKDHIASVLTRVNAARFGTESKPKDDQASPDVA